MSALANEHATPRPARALRFYRRDWPVARERVVYTPDSAEVPVPPALAAYVRGPRHFALVLQALSGRVGSVAPGAYRGARLECAVDLLRRLANDMDDPAIPDLLLLFFPPTPCGVCGTPYLRENQRRGHCSDACRRRAAIAAEECRARAKGAGE